MRVVVIGATGHIGSFLVPRLVRAGHDVVAVSRGERAPYREAPEWRAGGRGGAGRGAGDAAGPVGAPGAAPAPGAGGGPVWFTPQAAPQLGGALRPGPP